MNTFDNFKLIGANATRFVLIHGNASAIVGAYRGAMGSRIISRVKVVGTIELGLVPLPLLDGTPSERVLTKAIAKLGFSTYVTIYRPFDTKIKDELEKLRKKCRSAGYIRDDGSPLESTEHTLHRYENGSDLNRQPLECFCQAKFPPLILNEKPATLI